MMRVNFWEFLILFFNYNLSGLQLDPFEANSFKYLFVKGLEIQKFHLILKRVSSLQHEQSKKG